MCGWRGFAWSSHLLGHRHWSFWSICLYFHLFYSASALYFCICYSILICRCSYGSLAYLWLSLKRPSSFIFHVYFHRLSIRIKGAVQSFGCSPRWTSKKSGRRLWMVVLRWMCYGQSKAGEGRREKRKGMGAPAGAGKCNCSSTTELSPSISAPGFPGILSFHPARFRSQLGNRGLHLTYPARPDNAIRVNRRTQAWDHNLWCSALSKKIACHDP